MKGKNQFTNYSFGYWKNKENQIKFFEKIKKELNIKNPKEWGNISIHQIIEKGGGSILNGYYENSLFKALNSIYPSNYLF